MADELDPQLEAAFDESGDTQAGQSADSAPTPFEIPDDAFVTVKVGGEDKLLPWREARTGVQLHSDYTRKTQELATQRRTWETEREAGAAERATFEAQKQQFRELMQNPNALTSLALWAQQRANGGAPAAPAALTTDNIPQIRKDAVTEAQELVRQQFAEFESKQSQARTGDELERHMDDVLKSLPAIAGIRRIKDAIYAEVADLGLRPGQVAEAKQHIRLVAEGMAKDIAASHNAEMKRAALAKDEALRNGTQPRGGTAIVPRQNANWKKLEDDDDAIIEHLNAMEAAGLL